MKRTLLAMALLLTSVFGVAGCGSDDDVDVESRVKNVAPEASRVSDASGQAYCDLLDRLDDLRDFDDLRFDDLRDVRGLSDLRDRLDFDDLDRLDDLRDFDDLRFEIDLRDLLDFLNLRDDLDRGDDLRDRLGDLRDRLYLLDRLDLVDRTDDSYLRDLRDLIERIERIDDLDRLDDLRDFGNLRDDDDLLYWRDSEDLRDLIKNVDLRYALIGLNGLLDRLDQCAAASDIGADSVTTTTEPPTSATEPEPPTSATEPEPPAPATEPEGDDVDES